MQSVYSAHPTDWAIQGTRWGGSYSSAEMQSMYSTAPTDRVINCEVYKLLKFDGIFEPVPLKTFWQTFNVIKSMLAYQTLRLILIAIFTGYTHRLSGIIN